MTEVECRDCYDFKTHRYKYLKECIGGDSFTYGDIFYCRWQIIWVMTNLRKLQRGIWPDMPSVVTSEPIKKSQAEAHFVRACITAADVERRLSKVIKADRKLLKKEIELGTPINEMEDEAKSALLWCEGWWKKPGDYAVWKAKKTYRQRRSNGSQGYNNRNPASGS